jgi:hypothetical protein
MATETLPKLEDLLQDRFPQNKIKLQISDSNGYVVGIDDFVMSSRIIDRPFFPKASFTQGELYVTGKFEDLVQKTLIESGTRRYSGLHAYSHIERDVENAFKFANQVGINLDYITTIALIGHDVIEDHKEVNKLLNNWYDASATGKIEDIRNIEFELESKREQIRQILETNLFNYIKDSPSDSTEKRELRLKSKQAVRIIYQLTRFPENSLYATSMQFQMSIIGNEHIGNSYRRIIAKLSDRISNNEEIGPKYNLKSMEAMRVFLNDTSKGNYISEEFRNRFGTNLLDGEDMPPAEIVSNVVNNVFVLHFVNERLNQFYNNAVYKPNSNELEGLVKVTEHLKNKLIEVSITNLDRAINIYEKGPFNEKGGLRIGGISQIRERITGDIELYRKFGFYEGVTINGFLMDWIGYDAGGGTSVRSLDNDMRDRADVYRTARHLKELIPDFSSTVPGKQFTLNNLNQFLKLLAGPDQVSGLTGMTRYNKSVAY